jgi:hypothetical protein
MEAPPIKESEWNYLVDVFSNLDRYHEKISKINGARQGPLTGPTPKELKRASWKRCFLTHISGTLPLTK